MDINKKHNIYVSLVVALAILIILVMIFNNKDEIGKVLIPMQVSYQYDGTLPIAKQIKQGEKYLGIEINKNGGLDFNEKEVVEGVIGYTGSGEKIIEPFSKILIYDLKWANKLLLTDTSGPPDTYFIDYPDGKVSKRMIFGKYGGPEKIISVSPNGRYIVATGSNEEGTYNFVIMDVQQENIIGHDLIEPEEEYKNFKFIDNENFEFDYIHPDNTSEHVVGNVNTYFKK